jgi:hypothetical protein
MLILFDYFWRAAAIVRHELPEVAVSAGALNKKGRRLTPAF